MLCRIVIGLMLVISAYGQRQDTVFFQVTTNAIANGGAVLPAGQSIGQPYHLLVANFSDRPGRICANVSANFAVPSIDIFGGGSPALAANNPITNYVRIIRPSIGSTPESRYKMMASAAGAYPFISFGYRDWNQTDCQLALFYSGSLSTLDVKKYADFGTTYDSMQMFPINISTAGNSSIVSPGCADCRTIVYGLVLYNATAAQTIQLRDVRSDAANIPLMILTNYCAGCQLQLVNTNYPMFSTTPGGNLTLNLSAATPVSGYVLFRVE